MKIAHDLLTKPGLFWVQVIRAKYGWNNIKHQAEKTQNASHLWRSLNAIWDDIKLGLKWHIGEGQQIRFWSDHWVGDLGPLRNLSFAPISETNLQRPLSQYVTTNGWWKWNEFKDLLPNDILKQIEGINPLLTPGTTDVCLWELAGKEGFTVRSAYELLMSNNWDDESQQWYLAWKWPGPQRIRTFLWLVLSNKLLTNQERVRRHLTNDESCALCRTGVEDLNHVLRQCKLAKECWRLILPETVLAQFYRCPVKDWIMKQLQPRENNPNWCITFGIICWKLWSARNCTLFNQETIHAHRLVNEALSLTEHTVAANEFHRNVSLG